jgi:hypothetical protein
MGVKDSMKFLFGLRGEHEFSQRGSQIILESKSSGAKRKINLIIIINNNNNNK